METQRQWADGELLTATYEGDGDGSATFTSDINESIDREMSVSFIAEGRAVVVECIVRQIGLREILNASDGVLLTSDRETLNVLKE